MDLSATNLSLRPLPGEIWAVNNDANFDGEAQPRYLIIIREPQVSAPQLVTAMVLSTEIRYVSDLDILIPPTLSGLEINLLAQTANVGEIAIDYLHHRVGNRLSRQIYDLLLTIANPARQFTIDRQTWRSLGFSGNADLDPVSRAERDRFALHERAWLVSLHPDKIAKMSQLVTNAIDSYREPIDLSQWWQHLFPPDWQELKILNRPRQLATRRTNYRDRIDRIISELKSSNEDRISRQLLQELALKLRATESKDALIIAEIELIAIAIIDRVDDDELFWSAIECLQAIDPVHPRTGTGRCKSIAPFDRINLSIQLAEKKDNSIALYIKVFPRLADSHLPCNLQLIISDRKNITLQKIIARDGDYTLQLKFSGEVGERFNICLELDNLRSIDRFVI